MARALAAGATGDNGRTLVHRILNQGGDIVERLSLNQRTTRHAFVHAIADDELLKLCCQLLRKLLRHGLVHQEAIGRGAGLADIAHLGAHGSRNRLVDIRILENNERCITA